MTDVVLADGTKVKSAGCGHGIIFGETEEGKRIAISLENILYVPGLEGGLISVRKLAQKGFDVVFNANGCEIKCGKGEVITVGEIEGNQYKMKITEACMKVKGNLTEECQHTWHRRFGHRSMDVVEAIRNKGLASGLLVKHCGERIVCECCLKGNLTRKAFPLISN